jgi:hypothetical protein
MLAHTLVLSYLVLFFLSVDLSYLISCIAFAFALAVSTCSCEFVLDFGLFVFSLAVVLPLVLSYLILFSLVRVFSRLS